LRRFFNIFSGKNIKSIYLREPNRAKNPIEIEAGIQIKKLIYPRKTIFDVNSKI
jgi:hypothetical protein